LVASDLLGTPCLNSMATHAVKGGNIPLSKIYLKIKLQFLIYVINDKQMNNFQKYAVPHD
jgi:hypothetical protein